MQEALQFLELGLVVHRDAHGGLVGAYGATTGWRTQSQAACISCRLLAPAPDGSGVDCKGASAMTTQAPFISCPRQFWRQYRLSAGQTSGRASCAAGLSHMALVLALTLECERCGGGGMAG